MKIAMKIYNWLLNNSPVYDLIIESIIRADDDPAEVLEFEIEEIKSDLFEGVAVEDRLTHAREAVELLSFLDMEVHS